MAEYGMVYDVDDIKRQLTESNRDYYNRQTWKNMMQSTNVGAAAAQSNLQQQYSSATSQAYSSYLSGQTALRSSGVVGSGLASLEQQNAQHLQEAYDTYIGKLQTGATAIETQRQEAQTAIGSALTKEATNIKDYATAQTDYLQYLYETDPAMFDSKQWSKYTVGANEQFLGEGNNLSEQERARLTELEGLMKLSKKGNVKTEKDGDIRFKGNNAKLTKEYNELIAKRDSAGSVSEGTRRLMTREELMSARQNEAGEEIGLYDSEGNLTLKGVDFYDQLMNSPELFDRSYNQFLAETDVDWLMEHNEGMTRTEAKQQAERNAELYEWSKSYNPFNYSEDVYGESTNLGSFKQMVGMASDDVKYSFIERFGGYTETEIDDMYANFKTVADNMADVNLAKHGKGQVKNIQAATTQVFDLARDLGIDGAFKDAGINEDSVNQILEQALSAMKTNKEMNEEWWTTTLIGAGVGAGTGAAAGAKFGAPVLAIPVAGQILYPIIVALSTVVGAGVGFGTSAVIANKQKKTQKKMNVSAAEASKKAYLEMLTEMVNYSQQVRRQSEREFYFG